MIERARLHSQPAGETWLARSHLSSSQEHGRTLALPGVCVHRRILKASQPQKISEASRPRILLTVVVVALKVTPVFCGPASVGTVNLIKVVRESMGVSLAEAKELVDDSVFKGEELHLEFVSRDQAQSFVHQVQELDGPASFEAKIIDN